jgi:hypothetical protein
MSYNILNNKKALILSVESSGNDINSGRIFQVSVAFGMIADNSKWQYKTWRVKGQPIPDRYISSFPKGVIPEVADEDILPIEDILNKLNKLIGAVDFVSCWYAGFHLGIIAAEMKRAGMTFPSFHTLDAFLIFKEANRYEKNLQKTLEGCVAYYNGDVDDFGATNPHKKVQMVRWVLDRMRSDTKEDRYDQFFTLNSMHDLSQKLESVNALSHVSFINFLKKKKEDISKYKFTPWPPYGVSYEPFVNEENPIFSDFPDMFVSFDEYTNPTEEKGYNPISMNKLGVGDDSIENFLITSLVSLVDSEYDDKNFAINTSFEDDEMCVFISAKNMKPPLKEVEKFRATLFGKSMRFHYVGNDEDEDEGVRAKLVLIHDEE